MGGRFGSGVAQTSGVTGLTCTIVVSGELSERFVGAFADLGLARESGTTRLTGELVDQAELNGVLRQLMDLSLEIISVSTTRQAESAYGGATCLRAATHSRDAAQWRSLRQVSFLTD
jgi:hypothetical protein